MKTSQTHYPSLIGFILFTIAALLLSLMGFILGISALFSYTARASVDAQSATYSATMFFLGILLGTASIVSLLRFLNKPFANAMVSTTFEGWKITAGVTGTALALIIGSQVQGIPSINWLVLSLLTVPAVILPIWTISGVGIKDLPLGSRWRTLGVLGVSLTVTPLILFILETLVLIAGIVMVIIYVSTNPALAAQIDKLSSQLMLLNIETETGVEQALRLLAPYLMKPGVILPAVFFLSIIVPLMEELIKPLAVWLLAGKLNSAAQGFSFGAICGAGFAIWESFNVSGQTAEWGILLFTRIGTGLLHITTSALMGSAIFLAIHERRYLRLFGIYLLAVVLHGLWNVSAITMSFSALMVLYNQLEQFVTFQWVSVIGLISLAIVLLALLISSNRKFKKTMPVEPTGEVSIPQNDASV